jgi:signal transduction histidine kinase
VVQNGDIKVSVRDRGPGIPDEYLDKVFNRFFRVPDRATTFQSTGLGLTLVRGIARLHGGEVYVTNHAEGGCEFVVHLPPAQEQVAKQDGAAVDGSERENTGR